MCRIMKKIQVGKAERGYFALIDDKDYELVNQYKWYTHNSPYNMYAKTKINNKYTLMHRLILGFNDPKIIIDHKNHNGLDNRKANIRVCNFSQNVRNSRASRRTSSGYRGVHYIIKTSGSSAWVAKITLNYKSYHIGTFNNPIDAARAYNKKAKEIDPKFCILNNV